MPKIDIENLPVKTGSSYPSPFGQMFDGRRQVALGDPMGLTQFGANLVRLDPGAMSSLRHWHEKQDEFLVVTEGTLTLIEDDGETELVPGECAAFPAGAANGHHLVNRTTKPASFVVIGTRTKTETGWYSDVDMMVTVDKGEMTFTRRDGSLILDVIEDFATFSDRLTQALITGNYLLYRTLLRLPCTMVPRTGEPYVLDTEKAMEEDFRLYSKSIQLHHVTDIVREPISEATTPDGVKRVVARVNLLNNATRVVDPFNVEFFLTRRDDGWRCARIESALGHINWTLGRTGLPSSGSFEP